MSRKPIDQQQPHECRQAVWEWIRENGRRPFTVKDVACAIALEPNSIRDYLVGLGRGGYLAAEKTARSGANSIITYTLKRDIGVEAPRVRRDGTPVSQGLGRRQMWNAMLVLKQFSPRDLAFNASTPEHAIAEGEALKYCQILASANYLVKRQDKFALVPARWTGPHPPQVQRTKQLYDPNLKKVVWSRVEGGAE